MGKLNTAPRQAHFIFRLLKTLCKTPIMITFITAKVNVLERIGLNQVKKAKHKASSVKA